jgi:hypothetical protein
MRKHLILQISLIIVLMIAAGCYTVISHPGEEDGFVDRSGDYDNYSEDYGYTHFYYPGYWTVHPRWGRFYATPWWWDYYDYYETEYYNDDADSPRPAQGERAVSSSGRWEEAATVKNPDIRRGSWGRNTGSESAGGKSVKTGVQTETKTKQSDEAKEKNVQEESKENKRGGRWRKK